MLCHDAAWQANLSLCREIPRPPPPPPPPSPLSGRPSSSPLANVFFVRRDGIATAKIKSVAPRRQTPPPFWRTTFAAVSTPAIPCHLDAAASFPRGFVASAIFGQRRRSFSACPRRGEREMLPLQRCVTCSTVGEIYIVTGAR